MNPYANLMNPGEIGASFTNSFNNGMQMGQQIASRNALAKFAQNPQDPEARKALAARNPEQFMQIQEREAAQQRALLEQNRDKLIKGAQIVRQFGVKDQASWDAARQVAQQVGIDLSDVPQQYDPQYIQGLIAVADSFAPQKEQQATTMQRDYEFLKQQNPQLAEQYLRNKAEGAPLIANNGDGTFTIIPRASAGGQSAPPPPPPGFVIDNGGPTPPASGGFPADPLLPR